jgi:hypothetical protein
MIHISELAIDRLVAGEIPAADATAMRAHAATCQQCSALLDDALACKQRFVPPALPTPLRRTRVAIIAATTMLAAAAALIVAWPKQPADAVRLKGDAILGFYVAHGGSVGRGAARELVVPGDRIELSTTTPKRAWFAAYGVDAKGLRTIYVTPRAIEAGSDVVMPFAIMLDEALGEEVITGIFCDAPFDVDATPPEGCSIDRFTLVKQ